MNRIRLTVTAGAIFLVIGTALAYIVWFGDVDPVPRTDQKGHRAGPVVSADGKGEATKPIDPDPKGPLPRILPGWWPNSLSKLPEWKTEHFSEAPTLEELVDYRAEIRIAAYRKWIEAGVNQSVAGSRGGSGRLLSDATWRQALVTWFACEPSEMAARSIVEQLHISQKQQPRSLNQAFQFFHRDFALETVLSRCVRVVYQDQRRRGLLRRVETLRPGEYDFSIDSNRFNLQLKRHLDRVVHALARKLANDGSNLPADSTLSADKVHGNWVDVSSTIDTIDDKATVSVLRVEVLAALIEHRPEDGQRFVDSLLSALEGAPPNAYLPALQLLRDNGAASWKGKLDSFFRTKVQGSLPSIQADPLKYSLSVQRSLGIREIPSDSSWRFRSDELDRRIAAQSLQCDEVLKRNSTSADDIDVLFSVMKLVNLSLILRQSQRRQELFDTIYLSEVQTKKRPKRDDVWERRKRLKSKFKALIEGTDWQFENLDSHKDVFGKLETMVVGRNDLGYSLSAWLVNLIVKDLGTDRVGIWKRMLPRLMVSPWIRLSIADYMNADPRVGKELVMLAAPKGNWPNRQENELSILSLQWKQQSSRELSKIQLDHEANGDGRSFRDVMVMAIGQRLVVVGLPAATFQTRLEILLQRLIQSTSGISLGSGDGEKVGSGQLEQRLLAAREAAAWFSIEQDRVAILHRLWVDLFRYSLAGKMADITHSVKESMFRQLLRDEWELLKTIRLKVKIPDDVLAPMAPKGN